MSLNGKRPTDTPGTFYWGIWEPIIEALRDGRLKEIAQMEVAAGETQHRGRVFVLQSDGVALAWAPDAATLSPDLFEDLFPVKSQQSLEDLRRAPRTALPSTTTPSM